MRRRRLLIAAATDSVFPDPSLTALNKTMQTHARRAVVSVQCLSGEGPYVRHCMDVGLSQSQWVLERQLWSGVRDGLQHAWAAIHHLQESQSPLAPLGYTRIDIPGVEGSAAIERMPAGIWGKDFESEQTCLAVGEALGTLSGCTLEAPSMVAWGGRFRAERGTWREQVSQQVRTLAVRLRAADPGTAPLVDSLESRFAEVSAGLDQVERMGLVHGRFEPCRMVFHREMDRVVAVGGWCDAVAGDPLMDWIGFLGLAERQLEPLVLGYGEQRLYRLLEAAGTERLVAYDCLFALRDLYEVASARRAYSHPGLRERAAKAAHRAHLVVRSQRLMGFPPSKTKGSVGLPFTVPGALVREAVRQWAGGGPAEGLAGVLACTECARILPAETASRWRVAGQSICKTMGEAISAAAPHETVHWDSCRKKSLATMPPLGQPWWQGVAFGLLFCTRVRWRNCEADAGAALETLYEPVEAGEEECTEMQRLFHHTLHWAALVWMAAPVDLLESVGSQWFARCDRTLGMPLGGSLQPMEALLQKGPERSRPGVLTHEAVLCAALMALQPFGALPRDPKGFIRAMLPANTP